MARHDRRVWLSLLALGVRPELAREIAQETWLVLWEKACGGRLQRLDLPGLALRQARFLARSRLRKQAGREALGAGLEPQPAADPGERAHSRAQLMAIQRALVGHRDLRLFELVYGRGASHAEAATELGLSVQRTRQRLCELRGYLRRLPELEEPGS